MNEPTRTIVLWSPDWPITAITRSTPVAPEAAIALIDRGFVFACSAAARVEGVKRGLRVREAQARCPGLIVLPYEAAVDHRAFEPVIEAIETLTPGVQLLRPGMCAIRSRGPARYYGSEKAAGLALAGVLADLGIRGTRVGIADGPFAAEQAARVADATDATVHVVPPGASPAFLAPLPVILLEDPALVALLRRLGIRTLAQFAALPATDVRDRFGEPAVRLHALAGGLDARPVSARTPPKHLDVRVDFEPALDRIDQVTFGVRAVADEFIDQLNAAKLVVTTVRIEIDTENGELSERSWLHPRSFTPADVVDRVRWQLQGAGEVDAGLTAGIARVRIVPEAVDAIAHHERGLWGAGPDEQIHHGLSRVQSMLGHGAVLTAVIGGGRMLADRVNLVPWGDPTDAAPGALARPASRPWPGRLPPPAPATVFAVPHPVQVFAADGASVAVDERGILSAVPARFSSNARMRRIAAWAGPWTVDERWWDAEQGVRASRFQVVDETGAAWLLVLEQSGREQSGAGTGTGNWWLEARYD
jgi:protein ImuB